MSFPFSRLDYSGPLASFRKGLHQTFSEARAVHDLPEMKRINTDLLRLSKYQLSLLQGKPHE